MTLVMAKAKTKSNHIHMLLSDEETRKLDAILVFYIQAGFRDRTKVVRQLIEEKHDELRRQGKI